MYRAVHAWQQHIAVSAVVKVRKFARSSTAFPPPPFPLLAKDTHKHMTKESLCGFRCGVCANEQVTPKSERNAPRAVRYHVVKIVMRFRQRDKGQWLLLALVREKEKVKLNCITVWWRSVDGLAKRAVMSGTTEDKTQR